MAIRFFDMSAKFLNRKNTVSSNGLESNWLNGTHLPNMCRINLSLLFRGGLLPGSTMLTGDEVPRGEDSPELYIKG